MEKLIELKKSELEEIEGGFWQYIVGALVGAAFTQDLDNLASAWNQGYNDGYNRR